MNKTIKKQCQNSDNNKEYLSLKNHLKIQNTLEQKNISIMIQNLKQFYTCILTNKLFSQQIQFTHGLLLQQLAKIFIQSELLIQLNKNQKKQNISKYQFYNHLDQIQSLIIRMMNDRNKWKNINQQKYQKIQHMLQILLIKIINIVKQQPIQAIQLFQKYPIQYYNTEYKQSLLGQINHKQSLQQTNIEKRTYQQQIYQNKLNQSIIQLPLEHYKQQIINTNINLPANTFTWVMPSLHKLYISQCCAIYHPISVIKIKHIQPSSYQNAALITINTNYFTNQSRQEGKAMLCYAIPNTMKLAYYLLEEICTLSTISKQYYQQKQLTMKWKIGYQTKTVITPQGKIFLFNVRTIGNKIDKCMYEIKDDNKVSNRGPIPVPRKQMGCIYLNNQIYIIGGKKQGENCSKQGYSYSLKTKKWNKISSCNIAVSKPTLCTISQRFILKIGGVNEFNYINKIMEIYDSLVDGWALIRANPRNIMEEVDILENSLAIQISQDQIYIFGGKNKNNFNTDNGIVLMITQISQKKKRVPKISAEFWNATILYRNLLSFVGTINPSNVVIHHNCLYFLRTNQQYYDTIQQQ